MTLNELYVDDNVTLYTLTVLHCKLDFLSFKYKMTFYVMLSVNLFRMLTYVRME